MNATSNYLVAKFKAILPWTNYLVIKPVLVDEHGHKIWFQEDMDPSKHYAKKMFIGINQLDRDNGCAWLHMQNGTDREQSLIFDGTWEDFKTIAISFEGLNDEKHNALVNAIFTQICLAVDKGNDITTYRGILFEKNTAYKMMLECDLT